MLRLKCAAICVAVMALTQAGVAEADSSEDFIDYLASKGEDVSTPELVFSAIDLGEVYCELLEIKQSVPNMLDNMVNRPGASFHTPESARMWLTASMAYLCPELQYLGR